jgi:hypothetical protein
MPRRKSATSSTTRKTSPSKSHKRQLSATAVHDSPTTPSSRQSKRIKASSTEDTPKAKANGAGKATPRKSKYFEGPDSDEDGEVSPGAGDEEASGYEDEDEDASASVATSATPSSAEDEEDDHESDDAPMKKRSRKPAPAQRRSTGKTSKTTKEPTSSNGGIIEKGKELWRQGVKAGLGPGKAVFIERPKPRGDGGIKYVPERIHPNTMAFLGDLKKNNDREWMKSEWMFQLFFFDASMMGDCAIRSKGMGTARVTWILALQKQ